MFIEYFKLDCVLANSNVLVLVCTRSYAGYGREFCEESASQEH